MSYFISGPKDIADNSIAINPEGGLEFNSNNQLGIKVDKTVINNAFSVASNGAEAVPSVYQLNWCRKGVIAPNTYQLSIGDAEASSKFSYGLPFACFIISGSVVSYKPDFTGTLSQATAQVVLDGVDKPGVFIFKSPNEVNGFIYYDPIIDITNNNNIGLKSIDAVSDAAFTSYQLLIEIRPFDPPNPFALLSSSAKFQQKVLLLSNPLEPTAPYRTFDPINDPEDAATVVNSTTVANERLYPNVEKILKRNRRT